MSTPDIRIRVTERALIMILPKVRDPRFVTIRRGGTLTDSDHPWLGTCDTYATLTTLDE
jgi:hypothetical protein